MSPTNDPIDDLLFGGGDDDIVDAILAGDDESAVDSILFGGAEPLLPEVPGGLPTAEATGLDDSSVLGDTLAGAAQDAVTAVKEGVAQSPMGLQARAVTSGVGQLLSGVGGAAQMASMPAPLPGGGHLPIPPEVGGAVAAAGERLSGSIERPEGPLYDPRQAFFTLFEQLPNVAALMAAGVSGGPLATVAGAGALEAGHQYRTLLEQGVPDDSARLTAAAVGTVNGLLEAAGPTRLVKLLGQPKKQAVKWATDMAAQAAIEGGTEGAQEFVSGLSEILHADEEAAAALWEQMPGRIGESAATGALVGGVTGGVVAAPGRASKAEEAPVEQQRVEDIPAQEGVPESPSKPLEPSEATGTPPGAEKSPQTKPESDDGRLYRMQRPELEDSIQAAKRVPKEVGESVAERVKGVFAGFSREYKEIPHGAKHVRFRESMRRVREAPETASLEVADALRKDVGELPAPEYDLFIKKRLLDDLRAVQKAYPEGTKLPFGFTAEDLATDGSGVDAAVAQSDVVSKAVEADKASFKKDREELRGALDSLGMDTAWLDKRGDDYMHHAVLEQALLSRGSGGVGLKAPKGRGFQQKLKGSESPISLAYVEAQGKVRAQMRADAKIAKELAKIRSQYDKMPEVRKAAKEMGVKWRQAIPAGHSIYQIEDGRQMFSVATIKDRIVQEVMDNAFATITGKDLGRAVAVGGLKRAMVLPDNIVAVLEKHGRRVREGLGWKANEALQSTWKKAALFLPRRVFKYVTRNATSDWSVVLQGAPDIAANGKAIKNSARELSGYMAGKSEASPELAGWLSRGGFSAGLFHQELRGSEARRLRRFVESPSFDAMSKDMARGALKPFKAYWRGVTKKVTLLESIMRYTVYRKVLQEIRANGGKPKSYMASIKEEIDALPDAETKAYWLSNELIGAYDMVSEHGQFLREEAVPFWSFQELNARTQYRLLRNALTDDRVGKAYAAKYLGRTALAKAPSAALGAGKFLALASAFEVMLSVYNHTFFPEEEKELSESVRRTAHIVLGRKKSGEVRYFNRLSRFQEFREWMGLAEFGSIVRDYLDGRRSAIEIAKDMGSEVVDKAVNSIGPVGIKGLLEMVTGTQTFPQATRPRQIEDRWRHLFQMWGLEKEYDALRARPMKTGGKGGLAQRWMKSWSDTLWYSEDPGRAAWYDTMRYRDAYNRSRGKAPYRGWADDKGLALRRYKRALRYGQEDIAKKNLLHYAMLAKSQAEADGKTFSAKKMKASIERSIATMDPLYGIKNKDRFMEFLRPEERETVERAQAYYEDVFKGTKPFTKDELERWIKEGL